MTRYHIGRSGRPSLCEAMERDCPLGGEHYSTRAEAQAAFEKEFPNMLRSSRVRGSIRGMKNDSFYGISVENALLNPFLERWKNEVGEERVREMRAAKSTRDGGEYYHATVIRPKERRRIRPEELPEKATLHLLGVGKATKGDKEAWYVVARCPAMDRWRSVHGLEPHDFHITLGFRGGDVHDVPKDESTMI